jgi:hypothetical protein
MVTNLSQEAVLLYLLEYYFKETSHNICESVYASVIHYARLVGNLNPPWLMQHLEYIVNTHLT